ncbi:MAG TPA: hypothetical protein VM032_07485 [Vicinamibacterales bacterium]|nr:hypothetical protein [Vicinamibacterales bacterium]
MRLITIAAATALVFAISACNRTPARPASTAADAAGPASASPAAAAPSAAAATSSSGGFTGTIAETMDAGGYTYARLQRGKDEVWVAAPEFDARLGETIAVSLEMPMQDFQSRTLNRTFPLLYFVQDVARNGEPLKARQPAAPPMMAGHGESTAAPTVTKLDPPAGGMSVADVFAKKASLSGKTVTVRGTVVKFNGGIMDRNWLHLQDGSGSADAGNNDLTITSDGVAKVGDVVTVTGVVGTNRDFGAGYAYDVIVEKATFGSRRMLE